MELLRILEECRRGRWRLRTGDAGRDERLRVPARRCAADRPSRPEDVGRHQRRLRRNRHHRTGARGHPQRRAGSRPFPARGRRSDRRPRQRLSGRDDIFIEPLPESQRILIHDRLLTAASDEALITTWRAAEPSLLRTDRSAAFCDGRGRRSGRRVHSADRAAALALHLRRLAGRGASPALRKTTGLECAHRRSSSGGRARMSVSRPPTPSRSLRRRSCRRAFRIRAFRRSGNDPSLPARSGTDPAAGALAAGLPRPGRVA